MRKSILPLLTVLLLALHGASPAVAGPPPGGWLELPASAHEAGSTVITTRATLGGEDMRSFTYRYDRVGCIALWVAYPLNRALIGTGSRGEEWTPDPALPESAQPVLYRGFRPGAQRYDRGHQIPSADRLDAAANAQTFRFTNATPQLHGFNGGIWAELEKLVRRWCYASDTLYVVTGCIPGNDYINDNIGHPVNIPGAYYKAVLRLHHWKNGAAHYQGCAFLLPHMDIPLDEKTAVEACRPYACSLAALQEKTGEVFFPALEGIVGKGTYRDIVNEDPQGVPWWWR